MTFNSSFALFCDLENNVLNPSAHTFDFTWKIISGLLTLTIALLAMLIAYRQYRNAKDKLRLELFEDRFKIYDSANALLKTWIKEKPDNQLQKDFRQSILKASFLFGPDVSEYLVELSNNGVKYVILTERIKREYEQNLSLEIRSVAIDESQEILEWLSIQHARGLFERFEDYMTFKEIKEKPKSKIKLLELL
ncbi:MAG: hypothetical protein QM811_23105 [Pirellulales bacterium]